MADLNLKLGESMRQAGPQKPPVPSSTQCGGISTMENGVDYLQTDSPLVRSNSPHECCAYCAAQALCVAWTWRGDTSLILGPTEWRNCWLKPSSTGRKEDTSTNGLTSGVIPGRG